MDAAETARIYAFCCTTWRQRPSEAELAAWKLILADTPFEAGMAAAVDVARTGREFLPSPGLLVERSRAESTPASGTQVVGDAMFLPGSGWLGGKAPVADGPLAIEAPANREDVLAALRTARSRFELSSEGES